MLNSKDITRLKLKLKGDKANSSAFKWVDKYVKNPRSKKAKEYVSTMLVIHEMDYLLKYL